MMQQKTDCAESRTATLLKALKEGQYCQECENFEADGIFYWNDQDAAAEKIFLCNDCYEQWYYMFNNMKEWVPLL